MQIEISKSSENKKLFKKMKLDIIKKIKSNYDFGFNNLDEYQKMNFSIKRNVKSKIITNMLINILKVFCNDRSTLHREPKSVLNYIKQTIQEKSFLKDIFIIMQDIDNIPHKKIVHISKSFFRNKKSNLIDYLYQQLDFITKIDLYKNNIYQIKEKVTIINDITDKEKKILNSGLNIMIDLSISMVYFLNKKELLLEECYLIKTDLNISENHIAENIGIFLKLSLNMFNLINTDGYLKNKVLKNQSYQVINKIMKSPLQINKTNYLNLKFLFQCTPNDLNINLMQKQLQDIIQKSIPISKKIPYIIDEYNQSKQNITIKRIDKNNNLDISISEDKLDISISENKLDISISEEENNISSDEL